MSDEPEKPVTRKEFEELSALVKRNMEMTLWFLNNHEQKCLHYDRDRLRRSSRGCLSILIIGMVFSGI